MIDATVIGQELLEAQRGELFCSEHSLLMRGESVISNPARASTDVLLFSNLMSIIRGIIYVWTCYVNMQDMSCSVNIPDPLVERPGLLKEDTPCKDRSS